jgi:RNA recognition motif-containing protein
MLLKPSHLIYLFIIFFNSILFMNIFVAQLNFRIQSEYLKEIFEEYGEVTSAKVIMDQATGRSKGFGFVEMANEADALRAIEELDGAEVEGKTIVVKKARPKAEGERKSNFRSSRPRTERY